MSVLNALQAMTFTNHYIMNAVAVSGLSTVCNVVDYDGTIAVLYSIDNITGDPTTCTLEVKSAPTNTGSYVTSNTSANYGSGVGGSGYFLIDANTVYGYLKIALTIAGGTDPTVSGSVWIIGKKKSG